uniref:Peptidase S1 domain-containing protein n=1 Tax=Caenorhabditis japonica TaxID=281687 RepID=A0A8R1IKA6_CAEJA
MISNHAKVLLTVIALAGFIAAEWTKYMEHYRKANCGQRELRNTIFLINLNIIALSISAKTDENGGTVVLTEEDPIVQVRTIGSVFVEAGAGGIYVSRRHIITSAQAVLTKAKSWLYDGDRVDQGLCNEEKHLTVPEKYRKQIAVRSAHCVTEGCPYVQETVSRAIILFMCSEDENKFDYFYAMVLEFSVDMTENFPCIADLPIRLQIKDVVHTYGFQYPLDDFVKAELIYRNRTITSFANSHSEKFIVLPNINNHEDRGGPILYFHESRWWLVGVRATNDLFDEESDTYYYDVRDYRQHLCSLFSLCGRSKMNVKLPDPFKVTTASTEATTTELPTTTTILKEEPTTVELVTFAKPAPRAPELIVKNNPPLKATAAPSFILNPTTIKPQEKENGPVISSTFWTSIVLASIFMLFNF